MRSNPFRQPAIASLMAAALLAAAPVHAALDLWGAQASGHASLCAGGLCDGSVLERDLDGPRGLFEAGAALSDDVKLLHPAIDYQAQASLVGTLDLPELKAMAVADSTTRYSVGATAKAFQGYLYEGAEAVDVSLDVFVNGTLSGNASLSGFVNVYDATRYDPLLPNQSRLGNTFFLWSTASQAAPGPLSFTLQPGASVYLEAVLSASVDSRNGQPSVSDAFHTMSVAFRQPPAALTPATQLPAVPEPGSAALMLAGASWLAWRLRRRS